MHIFQLPLIIAQQLQMEEEEPIRKTSLRRFLRGPSSKSSPSKASKHQPVADSCSVASSSSYPTTGANALSLKSVASAHVTPNATPPHKKHHFGLLLRRDHLHLHRFFNRENAQNSRRFSPPVNEQTISPLATAEVVSPTQAEKELSRALNQLSSVTR